MGNHNQEVKLCGVCGIRREYNGYHRIYNPYRICVVKHSARYYQAYGDKINARCKLYQKNTIKVRKSQTQQTEELIDKVKEITRAMEKLRLKIE